MASKTGKSKKQGRNKNWCTAYENSNRREKNKVRRINKHLRRFPDDGTASSALKRAQDIIKGIVKKAA